MGHGISIRRTERGRSGAGARGLALLAVVMLAAPPPSDAWRGRARGSVRSVNRSPGGGSWSGRHGQGSTSRTFSGDSASRDTTFQGRGGQTATASRDVTREGDTLSVDRNVQSSTGASVNKQKEYDVDDGRVQSVNRDVSAQSRSGQSASWQGEAERQGAGVSFEGEGKNRYGQKVEAQGYGGHGYYGRGVTASVQGGRYGNRTVGAWKPYGGPTYVARLPSGARPYTYYGRPYYRAAGVYYRPIHGFYYAVPPPFGFCCYTSAQIVGATMLTVAGLSLLYSDGMYYQKTVVQGATQYKVVPAPAGATLAGAAVPPEAAIVTVGGTEYHYYANTFYKATTVNGKTSFVVVEKPPGVTALTALPADVKPQQVGSLTYLVADGHDYMTYLDASGKEQYILVDTPKDTQTPADTTQKTVAMTIPSGTVLSVRLAAEISSAGTTPGSRFQGFLDQALVAGGQLLAQKGARAYGVVTEAVPGTGTGGAPKLALALTDVEIGGHVAAVVTAEVEATGKGKSPGKEIVGGAALGAGIGAVIDGGSGAAWGAGIGAVTGTAAAAAAAGNQVAFAAGSTVEFRTTKPVTVNMPVTVQARADLRAVDALGASSRHGRSVPDGHRRRAS